MYVTNNNIRQIAGRYRVWIPGTGYLPGSHKYRLNARKELEAYVEERRNAELSKRDTGTDSGHTKVSDGDTGTTA